MAGLTICSEIIVTVDDTEALVEPLGVEPAVKDGLALVEQLPLGVKALEESRLAAVKGLKAA